MAAIALIVCIAAWWFSRAPIADGAPTSDANVESRALVADSRRSASPMTDMILPEVRADANEPAPVAADSRAESVSAPKPQHGSVFGHVIDERREPVAFVALKLVDARGLAAARTQSSADGAYDFGSIAPGRYVLRVEFAPAGMLTPFDQGVVSWQPNLLAPRPFATELELASNRSIEVNACVFNAAVVRGRVLEVPATQVGRLQVRLQSAERDLWSLADVVSVASDGRYAFTSVLPGHYRLEFLVDATNASSDVACPPPLELEVKGGEQVQVPDQAFVRSTAMLVGVVLDGARPMPGVHVLCAVDRNVAERVEPIGFDTLLEVAVANERGEYQFTNLPPGPVKVIAIAAASATPSSIADAGWVSKVTRARAIGDSNYPHAVDPLIVLPLHSEHARSGELEIAPSLVPAGADVSRLIRLTARGHVLALSAGQPLRFKFESSGWNDWIDADDGRHPTVRVWLEPWDRQRITLRFP